MTRNNTLDFLRGITIIAMVIFHFTFDLNNFHFISIDIRNDTFWKYFRWTIVSSFLFIMGYSLVLAYGKSIEWKKIARRFGQIFGLAMLITLATYFVFPNTWIYFGILHFIAFASVIGVFLVRLPFISLALAIILFAGYYYDYLTMYPLFDYLREFIDLPRYTEDYVPFFPWLSPVFLGIFAAHLKVIPSVTIPKALSGITFLGRHSLLIYMVHQPILFGGTLLAFRLL